MVIGGGSAFAPRLSMQQRATPPGVWMGIRVSWQT